MATSQPTLAGRPLPNWAGHALWFLVMLLGTGMVLQLNQLQDSYAAPAVPAPPPAATKARAAAAPAAAPAPRAPVMLQVDRQMLHGDYVWNDEGVPAGRVEVLVDIATQTLHVFRSGHEIGRAVILYGTDENPTPLGSFRITQKDIDHESNIYDAMMPYMMRLTDDGIAIHGAMVEYGKASRGCIGVPDEFAARLFEAARLGDRVRVVNGGGLASMGVTVS
jgi:lipoprotein-anchoring transpeptidase ErfK/SrfK